MSTLMGASLMLLIILVGAIYAAFKERSVTSLVVLLLVLYLLVGAGR